jgi:hypothetical protein
MTGARRINRRSVLLGAAASATTFSIGRARAAADFKEWRGRYGDAAWALLEKHSGKLS